MSFNPANFATAASVQASDVAQPAQVATTVTAQALREAGARWLKRHDQFADGKADTCFDMADKLDRFGSFVSDKQAGYAAKLIEWSQPKPYSAVIEATVRPPTMIHATATTPAVDLRKVAAAPVAPAPRLVLPKLIDLMQRLAKLRIGDLTISRKNGEAYCWIKHSACDRVVGKIEGNGTFALFSRPGVNQADLLAALLDIEKDPEAAAVLHGKLSGNCSVCGRDLTDPESVARGIGPICAGKF
jgi:hypothetical protein